MLTLLLALSSVRPEVVEGRASLRTAGRASTSSGRTEEESVIDAERAFAADAPRLGQWAAFRKWAAADATMFVPQPVEAWLWAGRGWRQVLDDQIAAPKP